MERAAQRYGANAPVTLALRKELEQALKDEGKPVKEQRYLGGLR
jgi:hypothetical protein